MEKFWNYIKENKVLFIIIAVLVVLLIIAGICIKNMKDTNTILETNIKAATEKVDSLELANGQIIYERQSYVLKVNELEEYIGIKKNEIKELQKKLDGKVLYISDLEGRLAIVSDAKVDTVIIKDSSALFAMPWQFNDRWYRITGQTTLQNYKLETSLSSVYMDVPLRVGLTEDWKIFATSENPYVSFSSIEGAVLDESVYLKQQKKSHWGVGVNAGMFAGYDLIGKSIYAGPGIGISVSYNFLTW